MLAALVAAVASLPPELPGDPLPPGVTARYGSLHLRAPGRVHGSALSPDGKQLALAGPGGVRLYDVPGWRVARELAAPSGPPDRAAPGPLRFSPDGRYLAYRQNPGTVVLWDLTVDRPGRELRAGADDRWGPLLAFTPGGLTLAEAGRLVTYDPATGAEVGAVAVRNVQAVSPDGSRFVRQDLPALRPGQRPDQNPGEAVLGDARTGADLLRLNRIPAHHDANRCGVAFAPDGSSFALLGRGGQALDIREAATGAVRHTVFPPEQAYGPGIPTGGCGPEVGYAADGTVYVVMHGAGVARWDPATGRELPPLAAGDDPPPGGLHALPGGLLLTPTAAGWVRVWAADGAERPVPGRYRGPVRVLASPDRATVAVIDPPGRIDLRAADTGRLLGAVRPRIAQFGRTAFSPDGTRLAVTEDGDEEDQPGAIDAGSDPTIVRLYRAADGAAAGTAGRGLAGRHGFVSVVGFTPDGQLLLRTFDPGLTVWDVAAGRAVGGYGREEPPQHGAVAVSPNGRTLVVQVGGDLVFCDPATGVERARAADVGECRWDRHPAVGWSADGRTAAVVTLGDKVIVLDTTTGRPRARLHPAPPDPDAARRRLPASDPAWAEPPELVPVALSPDGRWVLAGVPGRVGLWDTATGLEAVRFGSTAWTTARGGAFTGDGRSVVVAYEGYADRVDLRAALAREAAGAPAELWTRAGDPADPGAATAAAVALLRTAAGRAHLGVVLPPAAAVTAEQAAGWIADLGSPDFAAREAASKELTARARLVEPRLRAALKAAADPEVRRRLDAALKAAAAPTRDELRALRLVLAAELAGTPEARELLERWAGGAAGAALTEDAKAAVRRLDK